MTGGLPRRANLGLRLASDSLAITSVAEGGMGAMAGLRAGDELVAVGGIDVSSFDDVLAACRAIAGAKTAAIGFARDGETRVVETAVQAAAVRGSLDVVSADDGTRLRMIRWEPTPRRRAAALFIQGIEVSSIEDPTSLFSRLAPELREGGIACCGIDRRGVGDSEGLASSDFEVDTGDIRAAAEALRRDFDQIVAVGHSVGGMIAPRLGALVDAVVVYGTSARAWFDVVDDSARRQLEVAGAEEAEIEAFLARARADRPASRSDDERSFEFHASLHAADLRLAWSQLDAPALVLWGSADVVCSRSDAQSIVDASTRATLEVIADLDHSGAPEPERIVRAIAAWLPAAL